MDREGRRILLWDLDGTLTESGPGITNSVRYALGQAGIEVPAQDDLKRFVGPPLMDSFQNFCGMTREEAEEAVRQYRVYFRSRGMFENSVYPGVREALETLKDLGYVLAVATSKPEEFSVKILEHFGLMELFVFVGGSRMDSSRSRKKDVIRYVLDSLQVKENDRVLMIGDRENDVSGAAANGLPCLGVLYGYGSRTELEDAGAAGICPGAEDLPASVETLFRDGTV